MSHGRECRMCTHVVQPSVALGEHSFYVCRRLFMGRVFGQNIHVRPNSIYVSRQYTSLCIRCVCTHLRYIFSPICCRSQPESLNQNPARRSFKLVVHLMFSIRPTGRPAGWLASALFCALLLAAEITRSRLKTQTQTQPMGVKIHSSSS